MSDRELLELAAKAAGIETHGPASGSGLLVRLPSQGTVPAYGTWNPRADDGDAFRLVVRLKELGLWATAAALEPTAIEGFWDGDPYAATRRAIVRAAAEIGKAMP